MQAPLLSALRDSWLSVAQAVEAAAAAAAAEAAAAEQRRATADADRLRGAPAAAGDVMMGADEDDGGMLCSRPVRDEQAWQVSSRVDRLFGGGKQHKKAAAGATPAAPAPQKK